MVKRSKKAIIYLEGGGDSKELHARCREGFHKLLEKSGFKGRMPKTSACGGRNATYDSFCIAHKHRTQSDYVAMLVDSEDPIDDLDGTWTHLEQRDGWRRPQGAEDEQLLLMVTCMETWIVADRQTLQRHYGDKLQSNALPPLFELEKRSRTEVQDKLVHATRNCSNCYAKGKRSFELLSELDPQNLEIHAPSFSRVKRILNKNL